MDSKNLSWIQGTPRGFKFYYLKANSLVFVHQREHHVCFLQTFATSIGIRVLSYPGLMANWRGDDHHNNDDGNDVDNTVLTRVEFLEFRKEACDENQQFLEKSQQIIGEIEQKIATLLARKSSYNSNDQYIQRRTSNYKKISFFDCDMCKLDFLTSFLIWKTILIFGRFVMKKKCSLHLIN